MIVQRLYIALALVALAGCGDEAAGGGGDRTPVVATTAVVADFVRAVGADRVHVSTLIPANADPHDYEPRPSDFAALADAKLVVRSGGDLDDWLGEALRTAGGSAPTVTLIEHADAATAEEVDPHWWHDPRSAQRAIAAIRARLAEVDPGGAAVYRRNAEAYLGRLRALDRRIERCLARVPDARRKLVTSHDALGYYARRYGIEVIGTVIPARSTQAQASAGETARLIDTIRRERVRTIFAESSVNPKIEKAIAAEAGAKVGPALYADGLGPEGSAGATYLEAMAANTRALVEGFGGGAGACRL